MHRHFLKMESYFLLHNMISLVILDIKVLRYSYQKINSLRDILYFILTYFDMKYKISRIHFLRTVL